MFIREVIDFQQIHLCHLTASCHELIAKKHNNPDGFKCCLSHIIYFIYFIHFAASVSHFYSYFTIVLLFELIS